jgi:hypothetical protein
MVLAGEAELLGENLPRRYFVHHNSHLTDPGTNTVRRGGKPGSNRFSYGAATDHLQVVTTINYNSIVISTIYNIMQSLSSPECFHWTFPGNGYNNG